MDCFDCKATNPDDNRFCGQCGAKLGNPLEGTVGKKGLLDRRTTEMEITEAVTGRLMKWAGWLVKIATIIVLLFGLLLGKSYWDVRKAVNAGKTEIDIAIREGSKEIGVVRKAIDDIRDKTTQLNSDIAQYRKATSDVSRLEKEVKDVQGQVIDLGKRSLKVSSLEVTGPGPSSLGFRDLLCPSNTGRNPVAYCAKGSPPSLFQLTSTGDLRPVSSFSIMGFQDVSTTPKPNCTADSRGTIYVEKGTGKVADKPFLCARQSDNTYDWTQLGIVR
jgi:uncharacterized protein YoxC